MDIRFLTSAQQELDEAYAYYKVQMKDLGVQFLDEIFRFIKSIKLHPNAWPRFSHRTRRHLLSKFPYAVIYQIRNDLILIVAISHLHREPDYWEDRL